MEPKQNLLYSWEAVLNICPFLSIHDLLETATLSKEWNYMLKQYLETSVLPIQMPKGDAFKQLKSLYTRKLCVYTDETGLQEIKLPSLVKSISTGNHLTVLQFYDGRITLLKNPELLKGKLEEVKFDRKASSVVSSGEFLYCTDGSSLTRIRVNQQFEFIEEVGKDFTEKIVGIKISAYNAIVFTGKDHKIANIWVLNQKTFKEIPLQVESPIISSNFTIGNDTLYWIKNETVFTFNPNSPNDAPMPFKPLKGKIIVKILGGSGHFIALERTKRLLKDWNTNEVLEWCTEEGFDDFRNIFKNEKVTGQKLLTMDKTYMEDVLGISSAKTQSKMALRIEANNSEHIEDYIPHVWGRNDQGQIGQAGQGTVTNPTKFKVIPEDVDVWHVEGNYTFLQHRKNGQIFVNKPKHGSYSWEPLTKRKIWQLSVYKRNLVFIASEEEKRIPQALSEEPLSHKKQKLRTAKNIINQIQWDQKYNQTEFRVGYFDKFTGDLECTFEQLLQSEIKEYRILYFKRNNQTVWDKGKRIDTL